MAASGPIQKDEQMTVLNKATFECLVMVVALFRIEQQTVRTSSMYGARKYTVRKASFQYDDNDSRMCVWRESPIGPIYRAPMGYTP